VLRRWESPTDPDSAVQLTHLDNGKLRTPRPKMTRGGVGGNTGGIALQERRKDMFPHLLNHYPRLIIHSYSCCSL
jgi:hypothetical protein